MSPRWIGVGLLLLLAAAIVIALIVAVVRDVEADRLDAGGRRRNRARRKKMNLFDRGGEDPPE